MATSSMTDIGYEENVGANTRRKIFEYLRGQLQLERSSFMTHWRDLAVYAAPRRARFSIIDVNRGDRRNQNIVDSTGSMALRTLRSGMMGGITSPARPWFKLETPVPELNQKASVKYWLQQVGDRMREIYLKSNLYQSLPVTYGDIGQFATSAMMIEEDIEDCVRFYPFPIGTYVIATNEKGQVDTFIRDLRMTVKQLVQKFGYDGQKKPSGEPDWSKFSSGVQALWKKYQREVWIDICHVIMPNPDYDPKKIDSKYKKFLSVYYERGSTGSMDNNYIGPQDDTFLREKGYDYFPVLAPRWEVSAEDAYGTDCPGMQALGDVKQLQIGEKRTMQAVDKIINPPMVAPVSMRNSKTSILPGDISYVDVREGQQGFKPVYEVRLSITEMENKQEQVRNRIKKAYFEDLFLMLAESDRREITAREVDERHEEKLLALGPVLEQLNQDLLDPLIEITFLIGLEQGRFPPPPPELHGVELTVEYISIMHQAQKLAGKSGIDSFMGFVAQASERMPSILDKIDTDAAVDIYADLTSVPTQLIRSEDDVAQIRQKQQQAQQAQQQAELNNQRSQTAKNLAGADTSGNNALSALMNQSQAGSLVPQ